MTLYNTNIYSILIINIYFYKIVFVLEDNRGNDLHDKYSERFQFRMFLPRDTPASMWAGFIESTLETGDTEYIEIECGEGSESNETFQPGEIILGFDF